MSTTSRYIIGIDLGTSNTAVSFLDTRTGEAAAPQIFPLLQVVAEGEYDERPLLPSFIYLPNAHEVAAGSLDMPWAGNRDFCVGTLAAANAARLPGKTVSSAKSWLCADAVDRRAAILPWNRKEDEKRISPVQAARLLLEHLRDAWNNRLAGTDSDERFENQEIILTVPASFDAVARELTVQAANEAGLQVVLLEEPQAAFYSWLQTREDWRKQVCAGERILVCDIGGGTTDFSLIEVRDEGGDLSLQRIAVGEHILLGGDNMDLTLAYAVAARLKKERGLRLDAWQIAGLTHACRKAKEVLLSDPQAPPQTVTVLGRGSSVIGGTISVELTRDEVNDILLDGFLPPCGLEAEPERKTRAGLRSFGLDYATDPGITRHLAAFLRRNLENGEQGSLPSAILFNGGVTRAEAVRSRIAAALQSWLPAGAESLTILAGGDPDLAVARGACWYGNVRHGNAIRIRAGSSHSYYVGIESSMPAIPGFAPPLEALCVVPFGMEEGTEVEVPYDGLGLVVGETTEFRFFASASRRDDALSTLLDDCDQPELHELPPLVARLPVDDESIPAGSLIPVRLHTVLSEIGTLQLWCLEEGGNARWKLEYDLRSLEESQKPAADQ